MSTDDAATWQQIEELLDAALDQPLADRAAFVTQRSAGNPALRQRVLDLLAASDDAGDFMETGPQDQTTVQDSPEPVDTSGQIGPWRIMQLLGRGGMGEVYKAHRDDGVYTQIVALKLLRGDQDAMLARFESERQILADLHHPGIARLIDGGMTPDGRPYMAMEFIDGSPLSAWLKQRPSLQRRLQLFLDLCPAVSYAHSRLVVHRDIKPDNILVDREGRPHLLDFGIAKLNPQGLNANATQAIATPNYAAPEQFTGDTITTVTDVYGLGATLYFLLCQRPPVELEGMSLPRMLDRICHAQPKAPSLRVSGPAITQLRGDLDAICGKALARDPQQRYSSVQALADDLRRHLASEPVHARPPSFGYRAGRLLRRHAMLACASLAVLLSLAVGLGATSWQAHKAANERDIARREAARLSTMRGSILRLFRSAASELDTDRLTARELFAKSATNIARDFGDDPATAAALMQMLGELQLFTEDYAAARELLEQARALPQTQVDAQVRASIDINLAHLAYRDGNYDQARQLYDQAMAVWAVSPQRYPAERIWAATLASQLARAQGQTRTAVTHLRDAARQARKHWGDAHEETGIVLINLAVALYYDNRLAEALEACAEAWSVWQAIDKQNSPDALNLLANWGLFALRHGDPYEGEKRLAAALELRTNLYGASAAQATLMKNLGVAHRINGRRNAGMRLLEQGEWMAQKYAGAGGRLHASAVYALSRALSEEGQNDEARQHLTALLDADEASATTWHHLNQALLASLTDERTLATTLFNQALQGLEQNGDAALSQHADALALKSHWLADHGDLDQALSLIEQAIATKSRARHQAHYEVLRMNHHKITLLQRLDRADEAQALWQDSRKLALAQLGSEHPISQLLATAQATLSSSRHTTTPWP